MGSECPRRVPRGALGVATIAALTVGALSRAHADQHAFAYVTNTRSNVVQVVDLDAVSILTPVPVGVTPVDIHASPDGGFMYIANRGSNSVSVIDTDLQVVVAAIPVGVAPEGLDLSDDGSTLFVVNTFDNTVATPYELDITPRGWSLLVPNYGNGTLMFYQIKMTSLRPTGSITLGGTPTAVASILHTVRGRP